MSTEGVPGIRSDASALAAWNTGSVDRARLTAADRDRQEVAQGFEELLLSMLVKELRQTSDVKLFGESTGAHLLESLFDQQLATSLAEAGGIGIGERLLQNLPDEERGEAMEEPVRERPIELEPPLVAFPLSEERFHEMER